VDSLSGQSWPAGAYPTLISPLRSQTVEAPDGVETISTLVWKRAPKHPS
jgi:hypothetical protein